MNQDTQTQQKARPRRSRRQWAQIVEQWRASGQTAEDYAEQHDLGVDNLWRWSGRFRRKDRPASRGCGERPEAPSSGTKFLAVQVAQPQVEHARKPGPGHREDIEISWPRGPIVRLSGEVSHETLRAVVRTLAEVAPC